MSGDSEEIKDSKNKKNKKRILILLLLLLFGGVLLFGYNYFNKDSDIYKDRDAQLGILPGMSEKEIQQKLNTVVSEGMMNVSINPQPVFPDGKSEGNLRIENIKQNHYSYKVTIMRDDTGEEIYQSGLLQPGYYIENAKLSKPLTKGKYPATARFLAYEKTDEKPIGSAVVKISIVVEK